MAIRKVRKHAFEKGKGRRHQILSLKTHMDGGLFLSPFTKSQWTPVVCIFSASTSVFLPCAPWHLTAVTVFLTFFRPSLTPRSMCGLSYPSTYGSVAYFSVLQRSLAASRLTVEGALIVRLCEKVFSCPVIYWVKSQRLNLDSQHSPPPVSVCFSCIR